MTLEEKARESACKNTRMPENWNEIDMARRGGYVDGYIAGAKENGIQWHDLRKDPNDLPKEPNEQMKVNETWVYVKFFDNTYGIVDKGKLKTSKGLLLGVKHHSLRSNRMTNEEWIVEKWKKITKWYAKRVWWFVLLFVAIVTTVFILGVIIESELIYVAVLLIALFGGCSAYGIVDWLELEHKE